MIIRYTYLFILIFALSITKVYAQTSTAEIEPDKYFDFWLGTWDLTWEDADGSIAYGTNHIERILDGNVIMENFEALSGAYEGFKGKSYSVYNSDLNKWHQTWVDNDGAYLDFSGDFKEDKRIFKREGINPYGDKILQRMIFYNITDSTFTWDWEVSGDNGISWDLRWRIFYRRAKN